MAVLRLSDRLDVCSSLAILATCFSAYLVLLVIYRLFLSPIASFPGSKLTAASGWYEIYFDVVKGGQFSFQIQKWHQKYGPIIRINPWEIHISDPEFYDVIYSSKTRLDKKDDWNYRFGMPDSTLSTTRHELHHRRRAALNPYFSKRQVSDFSNYIQACMDRLCERLMNEYSGTPKVLRLNDVFTTFTTDTVFFYVFAWSYDFLSYPDFVAPFNKAAYGLAYTAHLAGHFPWIPKLLQSLPDAVVGWLRPTMRPVLKVQNDVHDKLSKIINGENQAYQKDGHRAVVGCLLESSLPPEELSVNRLRDETLAIVFAAIETTKAALCMACFHLLNNRDLHQQLIQELESAFPDTTKPPSLTELEKLPYLTAVIYESLRLSYGVASRLPRVSPHAPLQYEKYIIPPNVPVSMSNYINHHNEAIFPHSHTFDPARWLNNPKVGDKPLTKYLTAFNRGTRVCLGFNLAWAEMYIALANVFRRLDFELVGTGEDDFTMAREYFISIPKDGSLGIRVKVK